MSVINTILGLGASVIMPIVILVLGLVFKMKLKNAIRAGLTVGIGFTGINLAINLVGENLGGLVAAMQERFGLSLTITDVGWPAASSIAFGSGTFVFVSIIVYLLANVVCLLFKLTHTLNVDIFNYWHHILIGTMSYFVTGNFIVGIISGTLFMIINTILGERQEQTVVDFAGEEMQGLTFATQGFPAQLLFSRGVDWVLDRIPGVKKINFNLGNLPAGISFFGEPMILGFLLGGIISFIAGYSWESAIVVAVSLSAAMYLLPRMVSIMMEGLAPLTDAAREFMNTRFPGRKFNIAMDYCLLLGDRDIITMGIIAVPIVLVLAIILPGNKFLPFTDLTALPYWMIGAVIGTKRNSFRGLIVAILSLCLALWMATDLAPIMTQMAQNVGFAVAEGTIVSGFCTGWEWTGYIIHKIIEFFANIF